MESPKKRIVFNKSCRNLMEDECRKLAARWITRASLISNKYTNTLVRYLMKIQESSDRQAASPMYQSCTAACAHGEQQCFVYML